VGRPEFVEHDGQQAGDGQQHGGDDEDLEAGDAVLLVVPLRDGLLEGPQVTVSIWY
jgi:hypothetical protein